MPKSYTLRKFEKENRNTFERSVLFKQAIYSARVQYTLLCLQGTSYQHFISKCAYHQKHICKVMGFYRTALGSNYDRDCQSYHLDVSHQKIIIFKTLIKSSTSKVAPGLHHSKERQFLSI